MMEPESLSVMAGTTAVFRVKATGGDLQFQWQKNHVDLCEDGRHCNTDTDTLSIVKVEKDDEGLYRCLIENDVGRQFSSEALLTTSKYIWYHCVWTADIHGWHHRLENKFDCYITF